MKIKLITPETKDNDQLDITVEQDNDDVDIRVNGEQFCWFSTDEFGKPTFELADACVVPHGGDDSEPQSYFTIPQSYLDNKS